jgi:type I site-specific restriction endonuclease
MLGDGQGKDPLPFVFSSNGDGFLFHDYTATDGTIESTSASR